MMRAGDRRKRPALRSPSPHRERGSVTVLTAGTMILGCVLALIAVDLLLALNARARAQTAADAAALAAVQEMARPSGERPEDAATDFARRNGAALVSCTCQEGSGEAVVEVEVPVRLVFLAPDRSVRARARAVIGGSGPPGPSSPP